MKYVCCFSTFVCHRGVRLADYGSRVVRIRALYASKFVTLDDDVTGDYLLFVFLTFCLHFSDDGLQHSKRVDEDVQSCDPN